MNLRHVAPLALFSSLAACATAVPQEPRSAYLPETGLVTSADPRAQEAGMEMLRKGGTATDAAIATMLALTVVEPQSSGIGGGGFFVRGTADGKVETVDGREKAPAGATPEWFLREDGTVPSFMESVMSGMSVGVPGNVALAAEAHRKYGKLPWATLFEPAIRLARGGFKINQRLADYLEEMPERAAYTQAGQDWFYDVYGKPRPAGFVVRNEDLAKTFEAIAKDGPSAFYTGKRAEALAAEVAQATLRDHPMNAADLAAYEAKERPPVCGSYRHYRVCSMGPPTSGGVAVLQILGELERFDLSRLGVENPVTWHLFVEAQRLAYADRELYLADTDFISVPVKGLIDPHYLADRSALISENRSLPDPRPGKPQGAAAALADGDEPEEHGTSHIAVVDSAGTMISYTSTIEGPFGSGLMANGFYLNNELTDFSRNPAGKDGKPVANRVEGSKRPRSSMSPTVVYDPQGRPVLAVGAAGGSTIPVQTARSIVGVIDFGLSAEQAVGMPFIMAYGDEIMVEKGTWMDAAIPRFQALGHAKVTAREAPVKGGAILRDATGWHAARDPRIESGLRIP